MPSFALRRAARWVLAGAVVVFLDLRLQGFDVLHDAVGIGLVLVGLRAVPRGLGGRWREPAIAVAATSLAITLALEFVPLPGAVGAIAGLLGLGGTVLTVLTFRVSCRRLDLEDAASSWSTTLVLVATIWGGLAAVGVTLVLASGGRPFWYETPLAVPAVVIAFVPFVHLITSLVRTAAPAGRRGSEEARALAGRR